MALCTQMHTCVQSCKVFECTPAIGISTTSLSYLLHDSTHLQQLQFKGSRDCNVGKAGCVLLEVDYLVRPSI